MLNKILQAISQKGEAELKRILKEKEEIILDLEKDYKNRIDQKKAEMQEFFRKQSEQEVEEFRQAEILRYNFELQEEKKKIMNRVYEEALKQINALPATDFENLIKKLTGLLPQNLRGEIVAGSRTADVLSKILDNKILPKKGLEEEGFLFKSREMEIDLRISQLLNHLKEKINPKVVELLFFS